MKYIFTEITTDSGYSHTEITEKETGGEVDVRELIESLQKKLEEYKIVADKLEFRKNHFETQLSESQATVKGLKGYLENCEYHPDPCNQYSFKDGSEDCTCGLDKLLTPTAEK